MIILMTCVKMIILLMVLIDSVMINDIYWWKWKRINVNEILMTNINDNDNVQWEVMKMIMTIMTNDSNALLEIIDNDVMK